MSNSILATLVGNDSNRVEEFVCVFANILKSFLVALHEEGKNELDNNEGTAATLEPDGICLHPPVGHGSSTLPQAEHREAICSAGESLKSGLDPGADLTDRRGPGHIRSSTFTSPRFPAPGGTGLFRSGRSDLWPGGFSPGPLFCGFTSLIGTVCSVRYYCGGRG